MYGTQSDLAQRIAYERSARGWGPQQLIDALAAQGVTWHRNTIARVEDSSQAVKTPELIALASVFELPAEELLRPMAEVEKQWVRGAVERVEAASAELLAAAHSASAAWRNWFELAYRDDELAEALFNRLRTAAGGEEAASEPSAVDRAIAQLASACLQEGEASASTVWNRRQEGSRHGQH